MQCGKAPGPDGLLIEFYKVLSPRLVPILKQVFDKAFSAGHLPHSFLEAYISVILKKDKNPLLCSSYRPISLLCCDYKILTKILSSRLQEVISSIIHQDQSGFISGRQSFFNMRRLFNIIYSPSSDIESEILLSLDAEKAYDRIEWKYLFCALESFGFGQAFLRWIKMWVDFS